MSDSGEGGKKNKRRKLGDGPSAAVRIRVMKRDRFTCTYCGITGADAELEVDHIIPVSKGGSHHMSNLTTACRKCNQKKSDKRAPMMNRSNNDGLNGLWLHTWEDAETMKNQGQIIGVDGERVLVQIFSFLDGAPTEIRVMPKSEIYGDRVTLYPDDEAMYYGYLRHSMKRDQKEYEKTGDRRLIDWSIAEEMEHFRREKQETAE